MRRLRDTWLHYLADNLALTVHPIRRDTSSTSPFQTNAVNVQYLKDDLAITGTKTTVSIDVLNDDESLCLDMVQQVWHLLNVTGSIPKFDYTSGSPVATGSNISWNPTKIQFKSVFSDFYFRYSCLLVLTHTPML